MSNDLFFDENEDLRESSVYLGVCVLNQLEKSSRATIYEVFDALRKKYKDVSYSNVMNALTFLYMTGLVNFKKPYFELSNDND